MFCPLRIPTHATNQCYDATLKVNWSAIEHERTPNSLYNKHKIIFKRFALYNNILLCCIDLSNCAVYYVVSFSVTWDGELLADLPHYPTLGHTHMSLLINASPSLHCLGSTVRIFGRPRHRMVQHHSTSNPRLVWDFYSYLIRYLDLAVFASPCRLLVYETHVPHRPHYYVCTPYMHLTSTFLYDSFRHVDSGREHRSAPYPQRVEDLLFGVTTQFFDHPSQRSQRLNISPHSYVLA